MAADKNGISEVRRQPSLAADKKPDKERIRI